MFSFMRVRRMPFPMACRNKTYSRLRLPNPHTVTLWVDQRLEINRLTDALHDTVCLWLLYFRGEFKARRTNQRGGIPQHFTVGPAWSTLNIAIRNTVLSIKRSITGTSDIPITFIHIHPPTPSLINKPIPWTMKSSMMLASVLLAIVMFCGSFSSAHAVPVGVELHSWKYREHW